MPAAVADSLETKLALVRAQIITGDLQASWSTLQELKTSDPGDWRVNWHLGLGQLVAGSPGLARAEFEEVYDALPGEVAPKLALGFAAEAAGDHQLAARYFGLVWKVDQSYVSAAFGLARSLMAIGDRPGAITALTEVPGTSSYYIAAQVAAVQAQLSRDRDQAIAVTDLRTAAERLNQLALDEARLQLLGIEILRAALDRVSAGQGAGDQALLGCPPNERGLRFGLERSYRALARLAPDTARRIELVDQANQVRPRTLL